MDLREVIDGAIGPFAQNCAGYLNPPATGPGYIAALKLSIGTVRADMDEGLDGIVSYDRAEAEDAYVGQINMLTASSFCGVNGAVWGLDLAVHDDLAAGRVAPLMELDRHDGAKVPVLPLWPLLDAGYRLFGRRDQRRFNPLPGAMVICANKSATVQPERSTRVWAALALAVAEDRERDANLFIEDASDTETTGRAALCKLRRNVALSILRCGRDQGVRYSRIFIGLKVKRIEHGTVGCALACAPYVTLPPAAIPRGLPPSALAGMRLSAWEAALGLPPLPPYPGRPILPARSI